MAFIEKEVERSVPELVQTRLLKQDEIRHVLKQRTHYAQHKFQYGKQDFLRYLQYETKLFGLLMLRAQRKSSSITWHDIQSIRQHCIRRINSIYDSALAKYGKDRQLWFLSFQFAKKYSNRISRRKFLKALLLHPHWVEVWIEAALYEYEWNQNPTNARLLFQRGAQLNQQSPRLYLEFFKMEISVVQKHFLLLWNNNAETNAPNDNDFLLEQEKNEEDKINWKKEWKKKKQAKFKEHESLMFDVYSGMQVPKLIFRYSLNNVNIQDRYELIKQMFLVLPKDIKDLVDDVSLRDQSSNSKKSTSSKDTDTQQQNAKRLINKFEELRDYMFEYLEQYYLNDPIIVELLAQKIIINHEHNIGPSKTLELAGCSMFEKALMALIQQSGSEKDHMKKEKEIEEHKKNENLIVDMMTQYVNYLERRMNLYINLKEKTFLEEKENKDKNKDKDNDDKDNGENAALAHYDTKKQEFIQHMYEEVMDYLIGLELRLLNQFKQYKQAKYMDASLYQKWIHLLLNTGNHEKAVEIIQEALDKYPSNAELWRLYSRIYQRKLVCLYPNIEEDVGDQSELLNVLYKSALAACHQGLKHVEIQDQPLLWQQMIEVVMSQMVYSSEKKSKDNPKQYWLQTLHKLFQSSIHQCPSSERLKLDYLSWINLLYVGSPGHNKNNRIQILKVLSWFQNETANCSPRVYYEIIQIYERLLLSTTSSGFSSSNNDVVLLLKSVFEKLVNEHGKTSSAIWIWYVEFARKYMGIADGSQVYQKAMRTLSSEMAQEFYKGVNA